MTIYDLIIQGEISRVNCDFCSNTDILYDYEGEIICLECSMKEELPENEALSANDRNK